LIGKGVLQRGRVFLFASGIFFSLCVWTFSVICRI
jgi:hypothetical protein